MRINKKQYFTKLLNENFKKIIVFVGFFCDVTKLKNPSLHKSHLVTNRYIRNL